MSAYAPRIALSDIAAAVDDDGFSGDVACIDQVEHRLRDVVRRAEPPERCRSHETVRFGCAPVIRQQHSARSNRVHAHARRQTLRQRAGDVHDAAGATALQVTPCGASSAATIFVRITTPAFDAPWGM